MPLWKGSEFAADGHVITLTGTTFGACANCAEPVVKLDLNISASGGIECVLHAFFPVYAINERQQATTRGKFLQQLLPALNSPTMTLGPDKVEVQLVLAFKGGKSFI